MVTMDGRRWPAGLHNTPPRFGKLIEFDRFDASFFSVHGKQAQVWWAAESHVLDPNIRTSPRMTRLGCRSEMQA